MNRYPTYYFVILFLAFLLSTIFWWLLLRDFNSSLIQVNTAGNYNESIYEFRPIDPDKIIVDKENNRKVISNIVNIAVKDTLSKTKDFISEFHKSYKQSDYQIIYADSTLNFIQIEVPDDQRIAFKNEIKEKMSPFELLVWDESLFSSNETNSKPDFEWFLRETNLSGSVANIDASDITIAIIDNGFDIYHPALIGRTYLPYNVIDKSENVQPRPENHGTHVASIAAGNQVSEANFHGICQTAKIMPIKIEDDNGYMTTTYIIKGILYAIKNKADVINLSLGLQSLNKISVEEQQNYMEFGAKDEESFWNEVFTYAEKNNTICVLAAGNSAMLTGVDPFQRSPKTIKVGAIDQNLQRTSFSNYGSYTTIFAPGKDILGAKPGNKFEMLEGTSMAAPIITGFVALLKSQNKKRSNAEIFALLHKNTELVNNLPILKYKTLN
ncbi:S8 family peptidase [Frigoriflavimonas asaccharolytica]|uniref:Subtilisin family serine protease n=1 Tax=Frigoriflavimonas asaccharolytica TaxID=2735899 RepID=A0A8J8G9F5_9FLAO|nr:S8 family serine peptidase [Frigoriflavimonas asaccharolytica]NRS93578.1 subtilisin family serine protease [Frigoriflavimonas asaccharolytica]